METVQSKMNPTIRKTAWSRLVNLRDLLISVELALSIKPRGQIAI
jgi:hypothetical protein